MVKYFISICLICCCLTAKVRGQNVNITDSYIPAVDQGAGSGVGQENYSPDFYTGRLNYSAMLQNVKIYGINFPVGLTYSTSGVKVQEVSGSTGLGWSPTFGGSITRQVRGLPDDYYYGYCGTARIGGMNGGALNKQYMQKVTGGTWDSEPDMFSFSFLGFSGKFVLDADGNAKLQSNQSGIKIDYCPFKRNIPNAESKFILRDQKGNQYFFENHQTLQCVQHGAVNNQILIYIASWSITKIITANNQEIDFTYSSYNSAAYIGYTNYLNIRRIDQGSKFSCLGSKHTADTSYNQNVDISYQPNYLVKISGNGTSINLGYNLQRADLNLSRALTDISVSYNNIAVNNYRLNYDYFTSTDGTNTKRLKLASVSQVFPGNLTKTSYSFYYNENVNLPARNSVKTDYLGYYNASTKSTNIAWYGDKTADLTNSQANVLMSIKNLLGGSVYFEYELNNYSYPNNNNVPAAGLRIKRIYQKTSDSDPVSNQTTISYNLPGTSNSSGQLYAIYNNFTNDNTFYVTCGMNVTTPEQYFSSESMESIVDANDANVAYSTVTATRSDGSFTRYTFTNFSDYPDMSGYADYTDNNSSVTVTPALLEPADQWSNNPRSSYAFARGKVSKEEIVNAAGQPVKTTTYGYAMTPQTDVVIGIVPMLHSYDGNSGTSEYYVHIYTSFDQDFQLSSKSTQYYRAGAPQQLVSENYVYTTYATNLVRSSTTSNSGGKTYRNTFRYPFDVIPAIPSSLPASALTLTSMTWNNNISAPVEFIHSVINGTQETVLSANVTQYYNSPYGYLPNQEYKLENRYPIPLSQYVNYTTTYSGNTETDHLDTRLKPFYTYTSYDATNNVTQVESPAGTQNYTSSIFGYNGTYKIAQADNAMFSDIAYSSFEAADHGNWNYSGATTFDLKSITGNYYYDLSGGSIVKTGLVSAKTYVLTYWTRNNGYFSIAGTIGTPALLVSRNGWNLYKHLITAQTAVTISGTGAIDEIRLYPNGSQMRTSTFIPFVGVSSQNDENNQITYYEYDEFNRLLFTRGPDKNILKANCYSFSGEVGNCFNFFSNVQISGSFFKNDCSPGYAGSAVTYTVEAGRYSASSVEAANALAQNDIDQHGQVYANLHGTCVQQNIYARIELTNYTYSNQYSDPNNFGSQGFADVTLKLYSDAGCTTPYVTTQPLNITVAEGYNVYAVYGDSGSGTNYVTITVPTGASSNFMGHQLLSQSNTYTDPYTGSGTDTDSASYTFDVAAGTYYTAKPTLN